jgi:hypothetical protein
MDHPQTNPPLPAEYYRRNTSFRQAEMPTRGVIAIGEARSRMRDHTAATALRHSLAASARKIRSVDRETR